MPGYTRRDLLTRAVPGLALAALLPACGQNDAPPATPQLVATPSSTTPARGPVAASPPLPTPTPTLSAVAPSFLGDAGCPTGYRPDLQPSDPYQLHMAGEAQAFPFSEKVRRLADLVIIGMVRDILPARWVTPDGRRPANPHKVDDLLIITPVRVVVERVAKGVYPLPDIYFAASGGRIGDDCASYRGSGPWPSYRFGGRYLYFVNPFKATIPDPVLADDTYRYFRADYSYTVKPDGTVTIGPEHDITGRRFDDPPRTLTVDEALREIAALLAMPGATPTR